MLWEGKQLRDIREADVRGLIESGLEEHLQLEYKSALYGDGDRGRREFLQDICMFANTSGGILLVGVPELRDRDGQATGVPDPAGVLGLEVPNPQAVLAAYDARVMEAIEERLNLESAPIDVADGRRVLAFRVPNSTRKPHSVRHEGHIYFPARRERQRYPMSVREIKESAMRTESRMQQAQEKLSSCFLEVFRTADLPYLVIGIIPVFFEDFVVDVRRAVIRQSVGNLSRGEHVQYRDPVYSFDGIERRETQFEYTVKLRRNGLLSASSQMTLRPGHYDAGQHVCIPTYIDTVLHRFALRARNVFEAAEISAPFLLSMMLRTRSPLAAAYPAFDGLGEEHTEAVAARDYAFPCVQVDNLIDADTIIRPLCDQAHQLFGKEASPCFSAEGAWIARFA